MRSKHPGYLLAALIGIVLAACGGEEAPEAEPVTNATPVVEPAAPAVESATPAGIDTPVATQPAVLTLGRTEEHGQFIADASGRALYLLEADTQGSSSCYDACTQAWPPLISRTGTPRAGAAGVEPSLIGTIQRRDGTTQVTFGGHPLYYYTKDQGPGQATGQDVTDQWGEWYLVTPKGGKLEHGGHS